MNFATDVEQRIERLRVKAERYGKPAIGRMPSGRWLCVGRGIMRSAEDPSTAYLYWKLQQ